MEPASLTAAACSALCCLLSVVLIAGIAFYFVRKSRGEPARGPAEGAKPISALEPQVNQPFADGADRTDGVRTERLPVAGSEMPASNRPGGTGAQERAVPGVPPGTPTPGNQPGSPPPETRGPGRPDPVNTSPPPPPHLGQPSHDARDEPWVNDSSRDNRWDPPPPPGAVPPPLNDEPPPFPAEAPTVRSPASPIDAPTVRLPGRPMDAPSRPEAPPRPVPPGPRTPPSTDSAPVEPPPSALRPGATIIPDDDFIDDLNGDETVLMPRNPRRRDDEGR